MTPPAAGRRRRRATLLLAAAAATAGVTEARDLLEAVPLPARHVVTVATAGPGGQPDWREISGLDWDAARSELVAVSDRGRLLRIPLRGERPDLAATRVQVIALDPRPNAESVVALGAWTWIADERRGRLLAADEQGAVVSSRPLPGDLASGEGWRSGNSGVEALAHHPQWGWLAVPQRPRAGEPEAEHRIHAADRHWHVAATAGARSTLKAADLRDGQLRLLEKLRGARPDGGDHFVLLSVNLAECPPLSLCPARAWRLDDPRLAGHNLEALACMDDAHCWLASDSGPAANGRGTLLLSVQLPPR